MTNVEKSLEFVYYIHLKFVYLVKLLSNKHLSNFEAKNLKNASNFEGWGLTLFTYEKSVA